MGKRVEPRTVAVVRTVSVVSCDAPGCKDEAVGPVEHGVTGPSLPNIAGWYIFQGPYPTDDLTWFCPGHGARVAASIRRTVEGD